MGKTSTHSFGLGGVSFVGGVYIVLFSPYHTLHVIILDRNQG